jgi:hypothetical protein
MPVLNDREKAVYPQMKQMKKICEEAPEGLLYYICCICSICG